MKFKILEMLTNDLFVTIEDCREAFNDGSRFVDLTNTMVYSYNVSYVANRWMFVNCDYDTRQYRETVYDIEQEMELRNPRLRSQNELKQQFFALYDCEEAKLYISEFGKKAAINRFFNQHFTSRVKIRECFQDQNLFAETVHFLKSIKLVQDRALRHTEGQDLFARRVGNDLGLNMPKKVVTKICMPNNPINNLTTILQTLGRQKDAHLYDEVVIIGEDAFGAEKKFDYESFIGEITIVVSKNFDNRYIANEVRDMLILNLGGVEDVHEA